MGDFIGAHRGIPHEHDLIVVWEFVEHFPSRRPFGIAALIVLPHAFVEAVVEVEEFEVLELGCGGAEQFFHQLDERVH